MNLRWWPLLLAALLPVVHGRFKVEDIPESMLDANRSVVIDGDRVFVPRHLPKLTGEAKFEFLRRSGIDVAGRRRGHKKQRKNRRSLDDRPWRRQHAQSVVVKPTGPLVAADVHECPKHFDAITEGKRQRRGMRAPLIATTGRTYIFAQNIVYQLWRQDGLQQKVAYEIRELFVGGPQRVNAAFTNLRSGVTVLISHRKIFRFRWSKKEKRFYLARNSPRDLNETVPFIPRLAFQWKDGQMVVSDGVRFSIYDPYWNVATFNGTIKDVESSSHLSFIIGNAQYFPNIPSDAIGLAHNGRTNFLLLTSKNGSRGSMAMSIYDMKRYKIVQEYPISINNYVACLSKL
ncbi:hypothetical protein M3Y99_01832400 [Aphelenchoides fujianensis]|nr:hypothetical protein M3Y99_01832400 [Aphelenchoides fujianensis]